MTMEERDKIQDYMHMLLSTPTGLGRRRVMDTTDIAVGIVA